MKQINVTKLELTGSNHFPYRVVGVNPNYPEGHPRRAYRELEHSILFEPRYCLEKAVMDQETRDHLAQEARKAFRDANPALLESLTNDKARFAVERRLGET